MKRMIGIIVLTMIMLFISINILGSNVTVEEFKNKLSTIKRSKIETMECEIEIELEGNIIGNTKMYMKGNKMRMEIKGNVEAGMGDIIIIQDSTGSYTKINNEWQKGGEENNIMDQMKMFDHNKMINEIISKEDFKIESMKNNKATISYKEVMGLMGVSNIRMGLDLENGNILFQEQTFNTGKALIEFKYDKGKNIPKEIIVKNFPSTIERHLFFDSICWEDDNHILMYSMVRKWVNTTSITWTGESGHWDWSKGEIWRINVFTGEKELLLRREGDKYTGLSTVIKIDVLGDRKLISLDGNAYIMEGESTDWQEIEGIYEAEWINDNEIIGIKEENGNIVKYDIETNTEEIILGSDMQAKHFTYECEEEKISIIRSNSFVIRDNSNDSIKLSFNDSLIYNSNLFIPLGFRNSYFTNYQTVIVSAGGKLNDIRSNYLFEINFDSEILDIISYDNWNIIPNIDFKSIIISNSDESAIIVLDREKNVLKTIYFPLDQLDE